MSLCVEVCTIIAEVFLAAYLFERMLVRKRPIYVTAIYYCLYGVLIVLSTYFIPIPIIRVGMLVIFSYVGNFIVYSSSILSCIYVTLLYYVSVLLSDLIGGVVLSLHSISLDVSIGGSERLVYNVLAKLINLLLLQLIMLIFRRSKGSDLPYISIPLLLCQLLSAGVCYSCFLALASGNDSDVFLLVALCLLVINIVICVFVHLIQQFYRTQHEIIAAEKQRDIQLQYYQDMLARQEETRTLWHDIKKYFSAIEAMVKTERSTDAEECFHKIESKFNQINQSVDVGNRIISSILSHAVQDADARQTKLEMDIWVDSDLSIPPADLFIIIGNTLDNALEACAELPVSERTINLILRQTNKMLYYELSNPYTGKATVKSGKVHGYGLKNVRKCVEDNNGTFNISSDQNMYIVKILLNV